MGVVFVFLKVLILILVLVFVRAVYSSLLNFLFFYSSFDDCNFTSYCYCRCHTNIKNTFCVLLLLYIWWVIVVRQWFGVLPLLIEQLNWPQSLSPVRFTISSLKICLRYQIIYKMSSEDPRQLWMDIIVLMVLVMLVLILASS